MSFRQFGGINYAPKHNIVGSNYNTSNNLLVTRNIGQPNSYINFESDISGNINVDGNIDVSGNLQVSGNVDCSGNITAYEFYITGPIDDNPQSVVPKYYVDLQSSGFQPKQACVCATTENFIIGTTISGNYDGTSNFTGVDYPLTIDDYVVDIDSRILIKNQGLPDDYSSVQNGIYYLSAIQTNTCTLTRTNDMAFGSQVAQAIVPCLYGTENKATEWVQTNGTQDNPVTVGVNPLTFIFYSQFPVNLGEGLISTTFQGKTTISVDPSLNFLEQIGNPGNTLNIGTTDTTLLFKNNEYNVTPYSIGPVLSPPIVDITSNTSSTSVKFTWSIPSPATTIPTSLQTLNGVLYYCINNGTVKSYNIPTITSTTSPNVSSTNSITVSSFSGSSTSNNYYLQISDFSSSSLIDSSSNQLILWYSNYSPYPNVSYVGYSSFVASGTPSAVSFNTPTQPNNYNQLTVPVFVTLTDVSNNATGPPYIQSYKVFYNTSGSLRRYPTSLSSYQSQTFSISPSTSANVVSNLVLTNGPIFPDCSYDISSNAQNNQNPSYGPLGNYLNGAGYLTELPDYPTTTTPNPLFSSVTKYNNTLATGGYYLTTDTAGNTNVKSNPGIVIKSSTFPTSNSLITPVQQTGTVGNQSLSSSVTVTGTISSSSSSVTVGSFGTSNNYTNTSNNITVTSKTYDAYFSDGSYNQGFYLDCSSNMNINSYIQSLNASNSLYTATLSVTGNGVNPSANYQFYVDNISSNPTYSSITSYSINNTSNYYSSQVSGIWVLSSNPTFSVSNLQLSNMGDYFYASPLVTYSFNTGVTGSVNETNLTNVTNSNNPLPSIISITNNSVSSTISSSYQKSIGFSITFNNLNGQGSYTFTSLSVIVDLPSYSLANSIKTLNSLSTSQVQGYRVWSAPSDTYQTMNPTGIVPFVYIESGGQTPYGSAVTDQGYIDISYNNTWDISNAATYTNKELLIAAGNFTTNAAYYLNYSTYSGNGNLNTVNYTTLSGTKYATFAWNINNLTENYSNLNFTITTASILYQNSNDASYYFTNSQSFPLQLYFRYQTQSNFTTSENWGLSNGSYYPNTTWISFNASGVLNTNTTDYNINNITDSSKAKTVYGTTSTTDQTNPIVPAGTSITFTISNPTVNLQNPNASYLYLRIGIPNGYNAFNNVEAYLSSN